MPIKVCDAIMGSGKSSAAISYMNEHPQQKFIYITPYLEEAVRIRKSCPQLDFKEPSNKIPEFDFKKYEHTVKLITSGKNITSTHNMFLRYSDEMIDMIKKQEYTLIIDEAVDVLRASNITASDMQLMEEAGWTSKEDGIISGAVAILHDRTEYTKLMEELSGTKYLVDSMRANNHDFTNKLHVILGLIQIGEYDKAVSYIENISIIQRETLSTVMHAVDNASFAALLIGKIARASECNVKFILKDGIRFKSSEVAVPSEALVTIVGNLIDNALDAMNMNLNNDRPRELEFGVFTKPGTEADAGNGEEYPAVGVCQRSVDGRRS